MLLSASQVGKIAVGIPLKKAKAKPGHIKTYQSPELKWFLPLNPSLAENLPAWVGCRKIIRPKSIPSNFVKRPHGEISGLHTSRSSRFSGLGSAKASTITRIYWATPFTAQQICGFLLRICIDLPSFHDVAIDPIDSIELVSAKLLHITMENAIPVHVI